MMHPMSPTKASSALAPPRRRRKPYPPSRRSKHLWSFGSVLRVIGLLPLLFFRWGRAWQKTLSPVPHNPISNIGGSSRPRRSAREYIGV
ncbi:hypothetical protein DL93DRAFT_1734151 [Clavulina sp. PMI_390]|nr:hypothetical protein DL93DRAFT_1734151 [Clavulina sp. PMI_390]